MLPTHSDSWGLVVNEAMASGLPVICTQVAGCTADLVKANERIVAARDVEQLAVTMQEVATDSQMRERMSRESAELIKCYSPKRVPLESRKGHYRFSTTERMAVRRG